MRFRLANRRSSVAAPARMKAIFTSSDGCSESGPIEIQFFAPKMRWLDGLTAAKEIITGHPGAKILLLTTFADDDYIIKAIRTGAKGYILKQDFETVASAITAVHNGQTVFGNEIMNKIPTLLQTDDRFDYLSYNLTEKEFELIRLVADGLNNKEIAEQLFLSEGTVRNYLSNILMKLDLRDRTQVACFYYKNLL